jgi:hypothetical protein
MSATQIGRSHNTHGTRKRRARHSDDLQAGHVPAAGGSTAGKLKRETPMLKTLTAIAALAALLAINITPAHAWIIMNGGGDNGLELNGGGNNGGSGNGLQLNGGGSNGGGSNGGGDNGTSEASSTLSIEAFELPAETR